jgi:hypothetical protein
LESRLFDLVYRQRERAVLFFDYALTPFKILAELVAALASDDRAEAADVFVDAYTGVAPPGGEGTEIESGRRLKVREGLAPECARWSLPPRFFFERITLVHVLTFG